MKPILLISFVTAILFCQYSYAQCEEGQVDVQVTITTDTWPTETAWLLADEDGNILLSGDNYTQQETSYNYNTCVAEGECITFSITDEYGDGIYAPGGFVLMVAGELAASGNNFGTGITHHINCPAGSYCSSAIDIDDYGQYTTMFDNTWYTFTPTETATYNITTCGLNECDTRIYVYGNCFQDYNAEGPEGSYSFNDNNDCDLMANLDVLLIANTTYYIRIGDTQNDCEEPITFEISYVGPPAGCTDVTACNFNPIAAIDDGSCLFYPSPLCSGPDLTFDSLEFVNTLMLFQHNAATCDIEEGCVTGYGNRWVLSFSSKIDNIGEQDYYIGNPMANPQMFNTNNCHGHTHYNAYGDYRLFDMNGNVIPAGHKNGFCVMDLCGFGQYNCGDMGISSGCYDEYGAGTTCQWIDITEVPDGDYRMVILVNPYHLPDALGHNETNFLNNATQICIHIEHPNNGAPTWEVIDGCDPYVDCQGIPGGAALVDCNGECNGPGLYGDLYYNYDIDDDDINSYMNLLAEEEFEATTCNDLNGDGEVSIYDAALTVWCDNQAHVHNFEGETISQCNFPLDITNPNQTVGLGIDAINIDEDYIDIEMTNTNADVLAYQFRIAGIDIESVASLVDATEYPCMAGFNDFTNDVFVISAQDSLIDRQLAPHMAVRIYYSQVTGEEICIDPIVDIVNKHGELVNTYVYNPCLNTSVSEKRSPADHIIIQPNPVNGSAFIQVVSSRGGNQHVIVHDNTGRLVKSIGLQPSNRYFEVDFDTLSPGVYSITTDDGSGHFATERFVKL